MVTLRHAFVVIVALAGVAHAEEGSPLARARTAVDNSEYSAARPLLAEALAAGNNDPEQLAEIYRMTGITAAALNDTKAATDAFTHLLALSPKFTLPAGTSPKISRPFVAAGTYFKSHEPLHVKVQTSAQPPTVTLVIESDPLQMIKRAAGTVRSDGGKAQKLAGQGSDRIAFDLPHGDRLEIELAVLDEYGNRLIELGSSELPIVIKGAVEKPKSDVAQQGKQPTSPSRSEEERAWYWQWWVWGAASVAFAGGATYFGLAARSSMDELRTIQAQSYTHQWHDASDVESRARLQALAFNIGMGTAGVFALGASILYVTRPNESIAAVPMHGGAALVIGGAF